MANLTKVATTQEIKPGDAKQVILGGKKIALFNVGGTFYAIDDACPHKGGSLSEGTFDDTTVTCPWHGAEFDMTTGKALSAPAVKGVGSYKVVVTGDDIQLELP